MRIDRYTKVVLTVIAACLVWLSLGGPNLLPTAHAQSTPHVLIEGWVDTKAKVHYFPVDSNETSRLPVADVSGAR
jgi:hypothetical protein